MIDGASYKPRLDLNIYRGKGKKPKKIGKISFSVQKTNINMIISIDNDACTTPTGYTSSSKSELHDPKSLDIDGLSAIIMEELISDYAIRNKSNVVVKIGSNTHSVDIKSFITCRRNNKKIKEIERKVGTQQWTIK